MAKSDENKGSYNTVMKFVITNLCLLKNMGNKKF